MDRRWWYLELTAADDNKVLADRKRLRCIMSSAHPRVKVNLQPIKIALYSIDNFNYHVVCDQNARFSIGPRDASTRDIQLQTFEGCQRLSRD